MICGFRGVFFWALVTLLCAFNIAAASETQFDIQVEITPYPVVEIKQDLDFGVVLNRGNGAIVVVPGAGGAEKVSGQISLLLPGVGAGSVALQFPGQVELKKVGQGGYLLVRDFTYSSQGVTYAPGDYINLIKGEAHDIYIGASLFYSSNTAPGLYKGTLSVSLSYIY